MRCGCSTSLSLRAWSLRVGRAAGLRDLARRLITRAVAARLRIGATRCARHPGAPRGVALGCALAGCRGGPVFSHWSLALGRRDTARHQQYGRSQQCRSFLMVCSFVAPVLNVLTDAMFRVVVRRNLAQVGGSLRATFVRRRRTTSVQAAFPQSLAELFEAIVRRGRLGLATCWSLENISRTTPRTPRRRAMRRSPRIASQTR